MDVPQGTAAEVLDWVGDDPARAQAALDAENAQPTPRTTLVSRLETIASKEAPVSESTATTDETVDPEAPPEGNAPAPVPPAGEDLVVDLVDHSTVIGPANMANPDVQKPDDSYDLAANEARSDDDVDEAPIDATAVEFFQLASNNGTVVIRFDGNAVLLDANQALALSRDLRGALANVTY